MKRSIAFIIVIAMCLAFLSGCGYLGRVGNRAIGTVSEIIKKMNEPREFVHIPTERGVKIYTADMLDDHSVIMMLEGDEAGTYKIAVYDIDANKLRYICSNRFAESNGE
jgi:hypothetical protein